ncbi:MarR family winged helix-turn-helix transcriptional regulator [Paenibacillus roseipurpureus]|uniref:MarR family transcriptional regulator n=1 Tax=Paenibacillus roseopurpureus TaxID=2918901 RepID=A0AA96LQW3_9BACL|nr:MarR family transcriptional regulator [Paenibacillus sp. MBLB1832]WNR45539.1 MarR family transcriptional regulator [Paenibacillus sp. MBLB1832]
MLKILMEFVGTLHVNMRNIQEQIGHRADLAKLTVNQIQYVEAIHELGEPTISQIAQKLGITKASVTTSMNKLVNLGYAIKQQSSSDKRVYYIQLTEEAKKLISTKHQALVHYAEFIRAALTPEEAKQFEEILHKLVYVFKQV